VQGDGRVAVAKQVAPVHRRTVYVGCGVELPVVGVLEQMLMMNPFYRMENVNKLLFFQETDMVNLQLSKEL
jgi:hypothetical protein